MCARVGAFKKVDESDLTFDMLLTFYAHPVRAYHNLDHIAQVLGEFDAVSALADDPDCVEFALWMHDCVYFAERPDNEDRSADAAAMIAGLLGCAAPFVATVRSLIAVTRHSIVPARGDWALVADLDLTVLAAEWAPAAPPPPSSPPLSAQASGYDAYRRAIRQEFAFATDEQYRAGRCAFLNRMLDKERIYHTAYFYKRLESRARDNLYRELDELERGGGA